MSERDYKDALREFREGIGSGGVEFEGARFDPFGESEKEILKSLDKALRSCEYSKTKDLAAQQKKLAREHGCSLSILFHNIRSAKGPGLELLEGEIRQGGIQWDVIGLAETWLDNTSEEMMKITGYTSICASRKTKAGGGTALLIREGLTYRERTDISVFIEGTLETLFVEIVRGEGRKNAIIGVVYRPPGADLSLVNNKLKEITNKLRAYEVYIMGDFNVDLIKSNSHRQSTEFLEGFYSESMYPLISLPTRITDTSATLIDNIFTNNVIDQIKSGLLTTRISDHLPIFAFVGGGSQRPEIHQKDRLRRKVTEARIRRFAEEIEGWVFDEVRAQGVEANVGRFRNEFRDMYDTAFPWVKSKKRKIDIEKPWLDDPEFKELLQEKSKLYSKKIKGELSVEQKAELDNLCKMVNRTRQRLKRAYFHEKIEEAKGDLKTTWEVLGEVINRRKRKETATCRYFEKDGVGITEGEKISEEFCKFYCGVGPELARKISKQGVGSFKDYLGPKVEDQLFLSPTTVLEVEEICKNLNPRKSAGWDGVSPRVIKAVASELAGPLSRILNYCMREGHYPENFKVARVVPVFKAEDPTQFSNYRPVSVLPVLSQVFERVLYSRLIRFLDDNKVIIPGQYGFRTGHSTVMAITDMVEKVRAAWASKELALGVFIDLKKAFDTVDHEILLQKMEHYGIRGVAQELMKSYLKDRTQYVCYGGFESERGAVECGVPQGSVLGPLFFLLYVNDMVASCKELELVLFADDTNIFAKGKDPAELFNKVNTGLKCLSKWFSHNKLTLNLKKTEYVYFGGGGKRVVPPGGLKIGGEPIRRVEGARFLGVWIDEGITWNGHIDKVRSKIGQLLGIIGRSSGTIGKESLLKLYNGLVLPQLQYCLMAWGDFQGNHNTKQGASLVKLQKKFVGIISGKRDRYHADPLFASLNILKIDDLYRQQLRVHAWKFWNEKLPTGQAQALSKLSEVHKHNTRAAQKGLSIRTQDHKSIAYRVPKEWGTLGEEQRGLKGLTGFKKMSRTSFLTTYGEFRCNVRECFVCGDAGTRQVATRDVEVISS